MIIMSVDLGKARTGIAVSDESESFAFPREVITEYNSERLVARISDCAEKYGAQLIVVGLPINMDGSYGDRANECNKIGQQIKEYSGKNVVMWDERCTTVSAYTALNGSDVRGKKRKELVDAVAATIILEDYLRFKDGKNKSNC